ncbi:unnamed protein product [Prorocentrum cordatum]|uniref:Secreted protein n=1 Tax=Prorocentrum cordatum TaxID=2364126 RepID=A0ABN9Q1M0_9DINO|nr:unnamed protein product [Polarella glacialis]
MPRPLPPPAAAQAAAQAAAAADSRAWLAWCFHRKLGDAGLFKCTHDHDPRGTERSRSKVAPPSQTAGGTRKRATRAREPGRQRGASAAAARHAPGCTPRGCARSGRATAPPPCGVVVPGCPERGSHLQGERG